jgi:hypothetical protein
MKSVNYLNMVCLFAGIVLIFSIFYYGPQLSKFSFDEYKKDIDKNKLPIKAIVTRTNTHKGKTVYFRYLYNQAVYKNNQGGDTLYKKAAVGDSINIIIDSLHPENSYVIF